MKLQFLVYLFIGGLAAVVNLFVFLGMFSAGLSVTISAPTAFITAAFVNYLLCIFILFRHEVRWNSTTEILFYILVVGIVAILDLWITKFFLASGASPAVSKMMATGLALILNFIGRRFFVFPEPSISSWRPRKK